MLTSQKATAWDKILLFGDSITQDSFNQQRGFGFSAGLQHCVCSNCNMTSLLLTRFRPSVYTTIRCHQSRFQVHLQPQEVDLD
jgi:hypothetical protein